MVNFACLTASENTMLNVRSITILIAATMAGAWTTSTPADAGGEWSIEPRLSIQRQETGAVKVDRRVYVFGGLLPEFPWVATDTVEIFDADTNTWSTGPAMPEARDHMGVAAFGDHVYVIGGYNGDFLERDTVWVLDTVTGEWADGPRLPEARGAGWAVTVADRIYYFGGTRASGSLASTTYILDPIAGEWSQGADLPTPREHLNAVALNGFIHVLGGRAPDETDAHERYDPINDEWVSLAPMPTARSAIACAVIDDQIVACGGTRAPGVGGGAYRVTEIYDPAADDWTRQAPMIFPRHGLAAVNLDGRLFIPGGGQGSGLGPTDWVDSFTPGPTLRVQGRCPGPATLLASKNAPQARVTFAFAFGQGSLIIPSGFPCTGIETGLDRTARIGGTARSDSNGVARFDAMLPSNACGSIVIQAIDIDRCRTSNLVKP
ncbi:MAG: Kelch repeat-containing protein [Phycisphaerales bacterium]